MIKWCKRTGLAVTAALALCASAVAADDSLDAAIRQIERAVTPQRDGEHLRLLFALRQLREQSTQPLFYELVQRKEWPVQVHAVLALAELSEKQQVDPWLIRQMNPAGHEAVIANGLDSDLIGIAQMNELINHEELGAMPRLLLLAELVSLDQPAPRAQIERLCDHADTRISSLASALLMQLGDESRFSAVRSRLNSISQSERNAQLQWMFEAIRQYKLSKMQSWVRATIEEQTLSDTAMFAGVFALAKLGDPEVMSAWSRGLGKNPTQAEQIRYALLLFACAKEIPRDAFNRLSADDVLMAHLASAGKAVQRDAGAVEALNALFDLDHQRSIDLAREHVRDLPKDQAERVYAHLVDRLSADEKKATANRIELAVYAVSEWFKINPDAVLARLTSAEDDSVLQQALMLGLLEGDSRKIGETAQGLRRIGASRADSLALLLIAKHVPKLTDEQLRQLGIVASGGGRVSALLQTQAAWLYLQRTGKIEMALARLFPPA